MNLNLVDKYYKSPEYLQSLQARMNYLAMVEAQPMLRGKYILDDWAVNPISFIETFGYIKLPKYGNAIKPFFLFDYQKEIIYRLQAAEQDLSEHELLIDKPREMGLTWVFVWYMVWRWLFTPNWSGFVLSRTEAEVDDGSDDPDSTIFGKVRWALKHLPPWLMPEGFTPKSKKGTSTDMQLRILNPQMATSLTGSTTNTNAGRSRRYSFTFVDECFAIENFSAAWRSLQSVSKVTSYVSTVKPGFVFKNFKDYCERKGDYISLTWKQHPWKDESWHEEQLLKAEVDPEVLKEIDVDYSVNLKQQYYPEITQAKVMGLAYDPQKPVYVSLDFGSQDKTVIIWFQFSGAEIHVVECYASQRRAIDWYVPFLNPHAIGDTLMMDESKYNEFQLALIRQVKAWRKPTAYFGEAAHFQKVMPSNTSIAGELQKYGVRLRYNAHAITHEPRRRATSAWLPKTVFNEKSEYVMKLYDALALSRYNQAVRSVTSKDTLLKPVHDPEIADYRSAFENFAVNIAAIMRVQRTDVINSGGVDTTTRALLKYLRA